MRIFVTQNIIAINVGLLTKAIAGWVLLTVVAILGKNGGPGPTLQLQMTSLVGGQVQREGAPADVHRNECRPEARTTTRSDVAIDLAAESLWNRMRAVDSMKLASVPLLR